MGTPYHAWRNSDPRAKPQPSTHRVARARWMRWALIQLLGGKCVEPGCHEDNPAKLEFDHLVPRDWEPRRLSRWQRMRRYWIDWEHSRICLRCRSCNGRKGYPTGQLELLASVAERRPSPRREEPF